MRMPSPLANIQSHTLYVTKGHPNRFLYLILWPSEGHRFIHLGTCQERFVQRDSLCAEGLQSDA